MKIIYSIWHGSSLIGTGQKASTMQEIDAIIKKFNESDLGKARTFSALISKIETGE
jgi:hypothetical protein